SITRPIQVYGCEVPVPSVEAEIIDDGQYEEFEDAKTEDNTETDTEKTTQQTINNAIVFNQSGNNNIQIANVDTLTINNN
ncbi:MAG: hypothetical protein PHV07_06170, partial [Oscillospiraceae bacterium]|nr:hypothetical protein [Oscillospiraceae bacterium]